MGVGGGGGLDYLKSCNKHIRTETISILGCIFDELYHMVPFDNFFKWQTHLRESSRIQMCDSDV